ncbi:MAG: Hsp20/alpha crystallin family protein [Planctomycetota bacterium]
MANLVKKGKSEIAPKQAESGLFGLRRAMDDLFDRFVGGFDLEPFWGRGVWSPDVGRFSPRLDITDDDKEMRVAVELPGMEEKDLAVSVVDDVLTIKGEKKEEAEEKKEKGYYRMERSYGSFERTVRLPDGLDASQADAELKKGVLTVRFPKRPEAQKKRKEIKINAA